MSHGLWTALPGVRVFRYDCGLFGGSGGVLFQKGNDGGAVKIVP